ncbi:structural maintenance of chromosomes protein 3 isoform X2 [Hydra vulgaris]|uniref:Structural maintenance of chromosomes protein n=1 Tax=Hydra vulgaris TaxID=6087 RepID=A0ABM4BGF8_HYDVU
MYIKQVIIQGFRSYRDQTVIDPFSPKHNVVVGRNGSGKSNFFLAIQFVLSDEFNNMRQEERQQLLHEGTGPRVVSAYVEIIFDNSDNRIPIEKDEITLRRVIGSKKDQYFLDKKNVTKADVLNLLESAGFSRSNPYYIVKQGRINQLAIAKDQERLKLLREVAGTRVYDERKSESEVILKDTVSKRDKISEVLQYIEERLGTLETEKEELKQYQKWDKKRRCLEYTIHDKELKETREKLDQLDSSRQDENLRASELLQEAQEASAKVEEQNNMLKDVQEKSSVLSIEMKQLNDDRDNFMKLRTKLELDIKDLEDGVKEDETLKQQGIQELKLIEQTIIEKENELKNILPEFESKKSIEESFQARLQASEQRRTDLYSKQGRGSQFHNKDDRDKWIQKELKLLLSSVSQKEQQIIRNKDEVDEVFRKCTQIDAEIKERNENLSTRKIDMEESNRELGKLKKKRDDYTNIKNDLWRKQSVLENTIQNTKAALNRAEHDLRKTQNRSVATGIESVRRVVQEKGITGVYGTLIENFQCDEQFYSAVDVTAGAKLFNIIVDTDKTGTTILQHINKMELGGEINFMPLNRLHFKEIHYPTSPDVLPMISKINFDPIFKPAMQLAFGKMLICRNQDIASQFSKSHEIDTITLEGDKFSHRGTLEGGHIDLSKSRLVLHKKVCDFKNSLQTQEAELTKLNSQVEEISHKITRVCSDLQQVELTQEQLKNTYMQQKQDVQNLAKSKSSIEATFTPKKAMLTSNEMELSRLRAQIKSFQEELGTEILSQLTREDQEEVENLNSEIMKLKNEIKSILKERTILEGTKQNIEDLLSSNLYKRRDELQMRLDDAGMEGKNEQLKMKVSEFNTCVSWLERSSLRIKDVETEISSYQKKIKALQVSLEEWRTIEKEKRAAVEEDSKLMEKLASKRSILLKKKEECAKKIRELGSLPADAFEKHHKTGTKQLWNKLKIANDELKKYSHVNKKALDQFISFSEQKEKLIKRKEELVRGHEAILDLMDVLEQRKHEAILNTFKQVSQNFSEIFKQLVRGGKAQLIMKKELREEEEHSHSQSDSSSQRSMKNYDEFSGVSIKVSFTGKSAETLEMNQLSGGQKTLVALTLIFAIQKCDPAPFYLFDEIDQALDPTYRKEVAAMIHTLSENAQFITTTFRPELLEHAEKFYGVQFKNKVSHILNITKEDAEDFVEDEAQEQARKSVTKE